MSASSLHRKVVLIGDISCYVCFYRRKGIAENELRKQTKLTLMKAVKLVMSLLREFSSLRCISFDVTIQNKTTASESSSLTESRANFWLIMSSLQNMFEKYRLRLIIVLILVFKLRINKNFFDIKELLYHNRFA